MSCRNCCFTGRSWYLFWPHLTRSRGCRRILLTWDGIEGSAVIVICQERHCLCLWSLGLRNREIYVFLCALLQDSSQAYSSSLVWFIKHAMFISFNQFTSELLSIEFLWANSPLKQARSIFNAAAPIPNDLWAIVWEQLQEEKRRLERGNMIQKTVLWHSRWSCLGKICLEEQIYPKNPNHQSNFPAVLPLWTPHRGEDTQVSIPRLLITYYMWTIPGIY